MPPVFAKLNLKGQTEILLVDPPASFEAQVRMLEGVSVVRDPAAAASVAFALTFVTTQCELDRLSTLLADKAAGDAVLWFAYPKATSRHYRCQFNRDSGWDVIRALDFDSVRQVAVDDDWSALRFRRNEYIGRSSARR